MHWHRLPEGMLLSLTLAAENIEVVLSRFVIIHQILGQISVITALLEAFIWFLFRGIVILLFSWMQMTSASLLLSTFNPRLQYVLSCMMPTQL